MISINPPTKPTSCSDTEKPRNVVAVNLLPCKFKTSSPANATKGYWKPVVGKDEKDHHIAHFRGRKLLGRTLALPKGYTGVIIDPSSAVATVDNNKKKNKPRSRRDEYDDDDVDVDVDGEGQGREEEERPKECETLAEFSEIVMWGHEEGPDQDMGVWRGVEEWVGLAEMIHEINDPEEGDVEMKN